jgi:hypothetical protein
VDSEKKLTEEFSFSPLFQDPGEIGDNGLAASVTEFGTSFAPTHLNSTHVICCMNQKATDVTEALIAWYYTPAVQAKFVLRTLAGPTLHTSNPFDDKESRPLTVLEEAACAAVQTAQRYMSSPVLGREASWKSNRCQYQQVVLDGITEIVHENADVHATLAKATKALSELF